MMHRYTVYTRDNAGNVTVMGDHYEECEALEEEEILRINNPMLYIWVESSGYWSQADE